MMKQKDLPQRWQDKLQTYLQEIGSKYKVLSAETFQNDLRITFADRSNAFFYYAFYWIDKELEEFVVYTEHCGYHIFPLIDSTIETIDRNGNIIKTENFIFE